MSARRALVIALVLAGIIHILGVLAIPARVTHGAYQRVLAATGADRITLMPRVKPPLPDLDPAFVHALCRYDVTTRPLSLAGPMPATAWFVTIVDDRNREAGSFGSGSVAGSALSLLLGSPAMIEERRNLEAVAAADRVAIAVERPAGFVLIGVFAEDDAARAPLEAALAALACGPA